ncbi:hypothetical protein FACS1894186_7890 [Alphaproteobacteria bacterium]|nr:hypothetical protein FACS1894186_7890 [Alphaproteobacteria bacterium]
MSLDPRGHDRAPARGNHHGAAHRRPQVYGGVPRGKRKIPPGSVVARQIDDFKYIAYYNPALATDADGAARFSFTAPDNLTKWRIIVIGAELNQRLATAEGVVTVAKNVEARQLSPNQVSDEDTAKLGATVMNRTDKAVKATVEITASGDIKEKIAKKFEVSLEPFARKNVQVEVAAVPPKALQGAIAVEVKVAAGADSDSVRYAVPVLRRRTLDTAAQYGMLTDEAPTAEVKIQVPADIYLDTGGTLLRASRTLLGDLDGSFAYMRDYPYPC